MGGSLRHGTFLLVLLLVLGTLNCTIACTGAPCERASTAAPSHSLPPCHKHHQAPADKAATVCAHPLVIAGTTPSMAGQVSLSDFHPVPYWIAGPLALRLTPAPIRIGRTASPPGVGAVSALILRI